MSNDQQERKTIHAMPPDEAADITAHYVCSADYSQLISHYNPKTRQSEVTCSEPTCTSPGFVTRTWYERRKAEGLAELKEAQQTLKAAVPWMAPKSAGTQTQILKDLGF